MTKLMKTFKPSSILKVLLTVFCTGGLTYHTLQLFNDYMSGKTVASIEVGKVFNDTIPGITICYPFFISFEKLSNFNPDYSQQFKEYLANFENRTEMKRIYDNVVKKAIDAINSGKLNFSDILQNATINYSDFNDKLSISILFDESFQDNGLNRVTEIPIESTRISKGARDYSMYRCFTYFNWLKPIWRKYRRPFEVILIGINYDIKHFPKRILNQVYFMIHSPNQLPEFTENNCELLALGKGYVITYSQLRTQLLDSNYDTNCYQYDLDYAHGNFNMRSDCLTWCIQNHVNKKCKTQAFVPSMNLLRDETLYQTQIKTIGHCFIEQNDENAQLRSSCLATCKKDCEYRSYDVKTKMIWPLRIDNPNRLEIYIGQNNMPDILIISIPEITFISFVCNFGGLIGMWLGISILVIFDDVCKAISLLISKRNVFNQFIFSLPIFRQFKMKITKNNVKNINVHMHVNIQQNKRENPILIK